VAVGAEYSTGKFGGTETTDTLYIPVVVRHETGPWVFKATGPVAAHHRARATSSARARIA
jgi:hypothetical protein